MSVFVIRRLMQSALVVALRFTAESGDEFLRAFRCWRREEFGFVLVKPAKQAVVNLPYVMFNHAIKLCCQIALIEMPRQLHERNQFIQRKT